MITFYNISSIKRWIYILILIIAVPIIIGLIFKIPINQILGSIIVTSILVVSAVLFQKLGLRYSGPNSEDGAH